MNESGLRKRRERDTYHGMLIDAWESGQSLACAGSSHVLQIRNRVCLYGLSPFGTAFTEDVEGSCILPGSGLSTVSSECTVVQHDSVDQILYATPGTVCKDFPSTGSMNVGRWNNESAQEEIQNRLQSDIMSEGNYHGSVPSYPDGQNDVGEAQALPLGSGMNDQVFGEYIIDSVRNGGNVVEIFGLDYNVMPAVRDSWIQLWGRDSVLSFNIESFEYVLFIESSGKTYSFDSRSAMLESFYRGEIRLS